ncbi:MAG TPA: hypothetical protein VK907_14125 [Phnomibacter sp.]|nr:hypothetical protein [Phnomibacter sp.]
MLSETIRQRIETRFGRPIRYSKDCEALALSISRACHERLSATTLKRLFGFARQIDSPRMYTLDVVARYAGYDDWHSALQEKTGPPFTPISPPNTDTRVAEGIHSLYQYLSYTRGAHTIETEKVIGLCNVFGHHPAIIPFLGELITIASHEGCLDFLKQVFELPRIFDPGVQHEGQLYHIGREMGFMLRRHPHWADELIPILAANPHAQQYLVEWFVDEDHLTGYYGRLLDVYHLYRGISLQDRLFYYALKYNQALQQNDALQQTLRYQQLRELTLTDNIFCIPASRYAGIRLCVERDKKVETGSFFSRLMEKYVQHRPYEEAVAFTYYGCRQLFLGGRFDWMIHLLDIFQETYGKGYPPSQHTWVHKVENVLWMFRAFHEHAKNNNDLALEYFSRIDTGLIEPIIYRGMMRDYQKVGRLIGRS